MLSYQNQSFFLLGPRATGKSTWVKQNYPKAICYDLLETKTFLKFQSDPAQFRKEILALNKPEWIFIDEIQRLPLLLNEVHSLIELKNKKIKFILTGSSARKLKREGANLLAGRAYTNYFFPLVSTEIGESFSIEESLFYGNLPLVVSTSNKKDKIRFLESYVETYLKEEIQAEALVKNLSGFSRFLKVASILNGQKVNLSNISRDAGVQRSTAQGYFQILIDTMIGVTLAPLSLKLRVKEVDHPKFYFFDTGVLRTIQNEIYDPIEGIEKGFLLETYILHELRTFNSYHHIGGEFYYWGTNDGHEVDIIYSRGKKQIGIEIKSSKKWKPEYSKDLKLLLKTNHIKKAYGLYLGEEIIQDENIEIWPVLDFMKALYLGKIVLFE